MPIVKLELLDHVVSDDSILSPLQLVGILYMFIFRLGHLSVYNRAAILDPRGPQIPRTASTYSERRWSLEFFLMLHSNWTHALFQMISERGNATYCTGCFRPHPNWAP